jgi:L-threonylcarbamoyladenylate synthase
LSAIAKIIPVDARRPEPGPILQAARTIARGGVVVCPTRGLYGLAADAFNPDAVRRIYRIKGRPEDKPLLVLISDLDNLQALVQSTSRMARHLMTCFWPGKVTFVMPARADLPAELTAGSGKIGVRQTAHPVADALVRAAKRPLTGTSANLSGADGCARIADIDTAVMDAVDLVLDCGTLAGGSGSTVVDVCDPVPTLLRQGAVTRRQIQHCLEQFAEQHIDKPA